MTARCRRCDDDLATIHLTALYTILCGITRLESRKEGYEAPPPMVDQLTALLAGLCQGCGIGPQQQLYRLAWPVCLICILCAVEGFFQYLAAPPDVKVYQRQMAKMHL